MSIIDRIKGTNAAAPKKGVVKARAPKKELTVREELAAKNPAAPTMVYAKGSIAHRILLRPIVSEKSARLASINQYQFEVAASANKIDVKKAVIEAFKAEPLAIRMINVPGKNVVRGKIRGRTGDYRKAIVSMPKGVTIKVFEGV